MVSDELIVYPDAVAVAIAALRAALAGPRPDVLVHATVPSPRAPAFVTVERVGGIERNIVTDQPMLSIQAWAQTPKDAQAIAALCRAAVKRTPGHTYAGAMVYGYAEVGGLQHSPDPVSDQERYILTVQLITRGTAV